MAVLKEIKNRINSVKDIRKITNAMYLIASAKMRKARTSFSETQPYFDAVKTEIKRVFCCAPDIESPYFYPVDGSHDLKGAYAYLVITADKGLAGSYNQNVIRLAEKLMSEHPENKLYVVGEYGRHYFSSHNIDIEQSFLYSAQNPTMHNSRKIASILLDKFLNGEFCKLFVIHTDFGNGINMKTLSTRLLPFRRERFSSEDDKEAINVEFEFYPSIEKVLQNAVPSYAAGFIYSALVDSFCCEQSSRMTAMDSANSNASELLDQLSVEYNHVRQSAITQEITEISAGAKSQKKSVRRFSDK